MDRINYNFTLAIVFLTITWVPLQTVFLEIDGAGRVPTFLILFAFFINYNEIKQCCFRKPMAFYLFLAPYMFVNGIAHSSHLLYSNGLMGIFALFGNIFIAPLLMLLVVVLCNENYKKTLTYISIAIVLYGVICVSNGQMVEYADMGERLKGVTNANEVAMMLAIGFSIVLLQQIRKELRLTICLIIVSFLLISVIATGSRMGFAMVVITTLITILQLRIRNSFSSTIATVLLLIGGYILINYLVDNTFVGERLKETTSQTENFAVVSGTILDKYGDRGLQYYLSWPLFLKHPIFGIGFHQWRNFNPLGLVCHSEYMVQYVECGIIGITLYLLFFISLLKKLWECRKTKNELDSRTAKVLFATMCAIAFGNSVLWSYNSYGVFTIYGLSYAIIMRTTRNKRIDSLKRKLK